MQTERFDSEFLSLEAGETLYLAMTPQRAVLEGDTVRLGIPFAPLSRENFQPLANAEALCMDIFVRCYAGEVIRISSSLPDDSENPMIEWHDSLTPDALSIIREDEYLYIRDNRGKNRLRIREKPAPETHWSDMILPPVYCMDMDASPDGETWIPFIAYDTFTPAHRESVPLGFVARDGQVDRWLYSLHAQPNERFAGTGERFLKQNLSGHTLHLQNTDALGTNSRRAYKNLPYYYSSRNYASLIMTSGVVRLSFADLSTRAVQGSVSDESFDMFLIAGGPERAAYNYRRISGFPRPTPLWSYGVWMSRMTYFTAQETEAIADRLRAEDFPCDVIHLDTGWFRKDWQCEWAFNPQTFPDPPAYMQRMREKGLRVTLWQTPNIAKDTLRYDEAVRERYLAPIKEEEGASASDFGQGAYAGQIDFSNPRAVTWYQGLLENLLKMGASAIKTDFGENLNEKGEYMSLPYRLFRNRYALLYQKAAYEITKKTTGDGIIWARAGWIGCQRYPVHWGGDAASSWDGMAGSLRGGLHIGLSGFAFWSHDVPGFHSLPSFMNTRPTDNLYMRWTQFGVFTSHIRYHGACAREPYEYPAIAGLVRKWWNLRYALIPHLMDEGEKACSSGYPVLRSMIFRDSGDPDCWIADDQFFCGESLLCAPVMNDEGVRDVYLPEGEWVDFWTGENLSGGRWLRGVRVPLERMPVYAAKGSCIRVYPQSVRCTDDMRLENCVDICFDDAYKGLAASPLGVVTGLA